MIVNCPSCSQKLRAPDNNPGATLRCPACRKEFRVASARRPAGPTSAHAKMNVAVMGVLGIILAGVGFFLWQQKQDTDARREAEQGARVFMNMMDGMMRNDDPGAAVRRQLEGLDGRPTDAFGNPRHGNRVYYDQSGNPIGYSRDGK